MKNKPDFRDEILSIDLRVAVLLRALDETVTAFEDFYAMGWLLCKGDDDKANNYYAKQHENLMRYLSEKTEVLAIDDEFRKQYQDYQDAQEND